jgi:hypothetical protein
MIRVDAHHHVWRIARGDYGWLTPDLPIHRDYALNDLRLLLGDVTATVLVQAAPTEAETAFILDVAQNSSGLVRGVVGWADFTQPDAPERIATLASDSLLKGLRPMLQDIADTEWNPAGDCGTDRRRIALRSTDSTASSAGAAAPVHSSSVAATGDRPRRQARHRNRRLAALGRRHRPRRTRDTGTLQIVRACNRSCARLGRG